MEKQNFKNHSTLKTPTRTFTFYVLGASTLLIASFANLVCAIYHASGRSNASLIFLGAILFFVAYFLFRSFSIKAQDRAIRAEENLRYFVMTGKLLPSDLKINQITALRFASDAEFIALVDKALKENLSNTDIKKAIKDWRADYHRA